MKAEQADKVAEKYQMGFLTPDITPPVAPIAKPVTAQPPARTQDAETGRITFAEKVDSAAILLLEAKLVDATAKLENCRTAFIAIMRSTEQARRCSDGEIRFNITAAEIIAKNALKSL